MSKWIHNCVYTYTQCLHNTGMQPLTQTSMLVSFNSTLSLRKPSKTVYFSRRKFF